MPEHHSSDTIRLRHKIFKLKMEIARLQAQDQSLSQANAQLIAQQAQSAEQLAAQKQTLTQQFQQQQAGQQQQLTALTQQLIQTQQQLTKVQQQVKTLKTEPAPRFAVSPMIRSALPKVTTTSQAVQTAAIQSPIMYPGMGRSLRPVFFTSSTIIIIVLLILLVLSLIFGFMRRSAQASIEEEAENYHYLAGEDVVASKLDLANAYINMGNDGAAAELLESILIEGDEAQQAEAKVLLEQIDLRQREDE